jgi:Protein of unknown function (DUF3309)
MIVIAFRSRIRSARWNLARDYRAENTKGDYKMLSTILVVLLILLLIGALPTWPYSAKWGYAPGGLLGTVLVIVFSSCFIGKAIGRHSRYFAEQLLTAMGEQHFSLSRPCL